MAHPRRCRPALNTQGVECGDLRWCAAQLSGRDDAHSALGLEPHMAAHYLWLTYAPVPPKWEFYPD